MKALLISAFIIGSSTTPVLSDEYQPGYSTSRTCTRVEYREEYIPGTRSNPGYVKSWEETVEVPCGPKSRTTVRQTEIDQNDCTERKVAGGLLGGGLATAVSRGKDRWWAIPAGIVGGSMVGCQMDGG